jgi:hypothetical protein
VFIDGCASTLGVVRVQPRHVSSTNDLPRWEILMELLTL